MARTSANYIGPFSTNSLISMVPSHCAMMIALDHPPPPPLQPRVFAVEF
jgi:hypothetical protein